MPLGSFRYRKRKGSGASLMADVEVFPLAVNRELDDWPEKAERERRWFSLADAAAVVDEPDLADLIRSFGASEFNKAAQRTGMLSVVAEKSKVGPMFAWFQRLLPQNGRVFRIVRSPCRGRCWPPPTPPGACSRAAPNATSIFAKSASASMTPTRSSAKCSRPSATPS